MAVNSLRGWLVLEREREDHDRKEFMRDMQERDKVLKRIMDSNLRRMAHGFRGARVWTATQREQEINTVSKQRAICKRIVSANTHLLSMGFNKLVTEYKSRRNHLQDKFRFIIQCLRSADAKYTLQAYNGLIARASILNHVGSTRAQLHRAKLVRRLVNKSYDFQSQAYHQLMAFHKHLNTKDAHEYTVMSKLLKRLMEASLRKQGQGLRILRFNSKQAWQRGRDLLQRQKGILSRIVDSNTRIMAMGYNKLIEAYKVRRAYLRDKLQFVVRSLKDSDVRLIGKAWGGMKERRGVMNGVGLGDAQWKKVQLVKRLTNLGWN
jgi:hypothetical protein